MTEWHRAGESWPQPYRMVLVGTDPFTPRTSRAPAVHVGYMKYSAGDKDFPYFVCPGAHNGFVAAFWSDCLGDDFTTSVWRMTQPESQR